MDSKERFEVSVVNSIDIIVPLIKEATEEDGVCPIEISTLKSALKVNVYVFRVCF